MAAAAAAAGATAWFRTAAGAAHEAGAANRHAADGGATIRMPRERRILHVLAHFKTLWLLAFKLGDGFVNVGGHGEGVL
jgi:hypothetical protein